MKEIKNGGARGIQADIADEEIGIRKQRGRSDEENGGGKIAGHIERAGLQVGFGLRRSPIP